MEENLYQPPQSEALINTIEAPEFYVVSLKKFLILQISTLGLYSIYWFYQHWTNYKIKHNESMWPVMRGIFQIFFAHSLFEAIYLKTQQRDNKVEWSPGIMAGIFVLVSIVSTVSDRLSAKNIGSPQTDFISLLALPIITWVLYKAQGYANLAVDDRRGMSNSSLTAANYIWIVLGGLLWALTLLGLAMILFGVNLG